MSDGGMTALPGRFYNKAGELFATNEVPAPPPQMRILHDELDSDAETLFSDEEFLIQPTHARIFRLVGVYNGAALYLKRGED